MEISKEHREKREERTALRIAVKIIYYLICLEHIAADDGTSQLEGIEVFAHPYFSLHNLRSNTPVVLRKRNEQFVELGSESVQICSHMICHHLCSLGFNGCLTGLEICLDEARQISVVELLAFKNHTRLGSEGRKLFTTVELAVFMTENKDGCFYRIFEVLLERFQIPQILSLFHNHHYTVFTFMPALTLAAYQWMDKTHHKPLLPSFDKFGRFVARIMLPMALVLVILMVPSYLASNSNQYYYGAAHMFGENTRLGADTAAIEETFGRSDTYVVLVPEGDTATQQKLSDALHAIPEVTGILSYVDNAGASIPPEFVPGDTLGLLVSGGYTRMVLTVDADTEGDGAFALVERVRATVQQYYPDNYYLAGQGVSTYDLMDTITADMVKVNLLAIGAVFLILLLMKRQLLLPIILVLSIETAIWINLAIPYFRGQHVFYIAYLIISSVQLGATVDYAILFSDRYQEFRETLGRKEAVAATVSAVTTSVSTTGSAMAVVGFLMGAISTNQLLGQLGNFLGVGSLVSLAIVLSALPGFLYLADPLIIKKKRQPKEA